jgi:DNA-binding CsgD family transcriptional regulator
MNSFTEELMHGYTQYSENFDKWCEKATPVLGSIRQCGIIELDRSGNALIAANRPDIGEQNIENRWFDHEDNWAFIENNKNEITTHTTQFGHESSPIYTENFKCSWFCHRELINQDTQQVCFFASDSPAIYETIIQNIALVKKLVKFFKSENQSILNYYRDRKFNLACESTNYFVKNNQNIFTERDKLNYLLQTVGVLQKGVTISKREWQCIKMFEHGKSALETGEILKISRRTVETHWASIKEKLKVNKKSQILDIIN